MTRRQQRDDLALIKTIYTMTAVETGYKDDLRVMKFVGLTYHRLAYGFLESMCSAEWSVIVARELADKILRPCKRCWPKGQI